MTTNRMRSVAELRRAYRTGDTTPERVLEGIYARIRSEGERPIWITTVDRNSAVARARAIDLSLPLGGVPFAVKDTFDVAGMPTTAACPAFTRVATATAPAVQRLLDAGAILVGKTNLDQFATGLVGTRSPYGVCRNPFDARFISGGSSSGSAVATATGLCAFALGTDTAGSGRVPAAFNDLFGVKPTRGLISYAGVVPACRSLDCVSIFTTTAADGADVWRLAKGPDPGDPYSRVIPTGGDAAPWLAGAFRVGVPASSQLEFFGDAEAARLYAEAVTRLEAAGGVITPIDFSPFREASGLLYAGSWVAERFAAVGDFIASHLDQVNPVVAGIIQNAANYSAADAYRCAYRLQDLIAAASCEWGRMDVLLLPTAATIYTVEQIERDPLALNFNLGLYTHFVNLMDLAAVSVPAGFRANGLPFGVSLIGPAFSDEALLAVAAKLSGEPADVGPPPGTVLVAVVGAHLRGQPLNHQLLERGARFVRQCRTSREYRLFALANTTPPKPGMLRDPAFIGPGMVVEVWAVPEDEFGAFVARVPPPLTIGSVSLDDGSSVKGFLCESSAIPMSDEITSFGAWTEYLESLALR